MNAVIQTKKLKRHFKVGKEVVEALRGVDITIQKGEYVALMGTSGSGKSTLMNILGCLDTPTSGSYILNEKDVSRLNDQELAEVRNTKIGFVFQSFNLLPRYSALDNVALPLIYNGIPKKNRTERAKEMLELVGLENRMLHQPNELSGGQRQRVAIARALINNPSIILADEPTGNLDSKTSNEILNLLDQIHDNGNTIVMVTHEDEVAAKAQKTIYMKDGLTQPLM